MIIDLRIVFQAEAPAQGLCYQGGYDPFIPGSGIWRPIDATCATCCRKSPLKEMTEQPGKCEDFKPRYLCGDCHSLEESKKVVKCTDCNSRFLFGEMTQSGKSLFCKDCAFRDQFKQEHNKLWDKLQTRETNKGMVQWDLFMINEYRRFLGWLPVQLCDNGCLRPSFGKTCGGCLRK